MKDIEKLSYETKRSITLSLTVAIVLILAFVCPAAAGPGDIDASGSVDLQDAVYAIQVSVGMVPSVPIDAGADVNGDGRIGIQEVIYIMQVLAGIRDMGGAAAALSVQHANNMPIRLAQGPEDKFYVSDAKAGSVFIYDRDLDSVVGELTGLDHPLGVAVDADGNIYVGNNGRDNVEVYSPEGEKLFVIDDGAILMPNDLAFDQAGNLYVVDSQSNTVKVYDAGGQWQRDIGVPGASAGELQFPTSLTVAYRQGSSVYGELFVADQGNSRVQVFDLAGNFLRSFGSAVAAFSSNWHGKFAKIQSLALDNQGRLHAADCYLNNVQMLNADTGQYLDSYGTFGSAAGQLNLPLDILIASNGQVAVTNAGNHRVEIFYTIP